MDDGRAYPDSQSNDGIYSAFVIPNCVDDGSLYDDAKDETVMLYSVSVTAINGGNARVPKLETGNK